MGDFAPSVRSLMIGGIQKPFPKLVASKAIAIKDVLANKIIEFVAIRAKLRPAEVDEIDREFDGQVSSLEEEHAFSSDDTQKNGLRVKIDNLKRQKMFKKAAAQDEADKIVENETFIFIRDVLLENAVKVASIAVGSFDDSGTLTPMDEKKLSSVITTEELADVVEFILEDILATKKKLNGIGGKLGELLNVTE